MNTPLPKFIKEEKLYQFFKLIDKYKDYLVIVEGKKDKEALAILGFKRIKTLNKALYKVIEEINKGEKVLILTDGDKTGKILYRILSSELVQRGVKVENKLRNFLFRNTRINCVESLRKLVLKNYLNYSKNNWSPFS